MGVFVTANTRTEHNTPQDGAVDKVQDLGLAAGSPSLAAVMTWNVRGMAWTNRASGQRRNAKLRLITSALRRGTIVALQETKSTTEAMGNLLHHGGVEVEMFHSERINQTAGGVAVILPKLRGPLRRRTTKSDDIVPGRILRTDSTTVTQKATGTVRTKLIIWCIHNSDIREDKLRQVNRMIETDTMWAKEDPERRMVMVVGDFNLPPTSAMPLLVERAIGGDNHSLFARTDEGRRTRWGPLDRSLSGLTMLDHEQYTHYDRPTNKLSRLDEIFCTTPNWLLAALSLTATVAADPVLLSGAGTSDHCAVMLHIETGNVVKKARIKLAGDQRKHFNNYITKCMAQIDIKKEAFDVQHRFWKRLLKEACACAKDGDVRAQTPSGRMTLYRAMGRAIAMGSWLPIRAEWRDHRSVRVHLREENGVPRLRRPHEFAVEHDQSMEKIVRQRMHATRLTAGVASKTATRKAAMRQMEGLERQLRAWTPLHRAKRLTSIVTEIGDGEVTGSAAVHDRLADYWYDTFRHKEADPDAMEPFAERFPMDLPMHNANMGISVEDVTSFLRRTTDSAPGPDGIPYSLWKWAPKEAHAHLQSVTNRLMDDLYVADDFNDCVGFFPPKGDLPEDDIACKRKASETRPLAAKNTDNKTALSVLTNKVAPHLPTVITEVQRGFVQTRNLGRNVVDLDALARRASFEGQDNSDYPMLITLDFGAAFASVARTWIWRVLEASSLPKGYVTALKAAYRWVACYAASKGQDTNEATLLFFVNSGILQGCPTSGLVWAVLSHPFLAGIDRMLQRQALGWVRACADDIGIVLRKGIGLLRLKRLMDRIEAGTLLKLKTKKCVIVPLWGPLTAEATRLARAIINICAGGWANFSVADRALYLGILLGPGVAEDMWTEPMTKWATRACDIMQHAGGPTGFTAASLYTRLAASCLGYVAQYCPMPLAVMVQQKYLMAKTVKFPANSMTRRGWQDWRLWGGPSLPDLGVVGQATLLRAAKHTFTDWQRHCAMLDRLSEDLPYQDRDWASPPFWLSSPICMNLRWARNGFKATERPPQLRSNPTQLATTERIGRAMQVLRIPKRELHNAQHLMTTAGNAVIPTDTLFHTMCNKLQKWGAPELRPRLLQVRASLFTAPASWRLQIVRTWTNSWMTSARLRSGDAPVGPCIFGCGGCRDDQAHYNVCPRLHATAQRQVGPKLVGPHGVMPLEVFLGLQEDGSLAVTERFHMATFAAMYYHRERVTPHCNPAEIAKLMGMGRHSRGRRVADAHSQMLDAD